VTDPRQRLTAQRAHMDLQTSSHYQLTIHRPGYSEPGASRCDTRDVSGTTMTRFTTSLGPISSISGYLTI
jgi:hypothetical protein